MRYQERGECTGARTGRLRHALHTILVLRTVQLLARPRCALDMFGVPQTLAVLMVRHRGIGMNRAKKRKVSPLVPVPEVTEEIEEEEEPEPLPEPDPPEPALDPSVEPLDPRDMERPDWPDCEQQMYDERAKAARHHADVVNARYRKTIHTYFNTQRVWYQPPSVYERVMERLQHADDEMDEAIESYKACYRDASLFRKFVRRHLRWQRHPRSKKLERRAHRSEAKLRRFRVHREFAPWLGKPKRASGRDNSGVLDMIARKFGLVEAYQWLRI